MNIHENTALLDAFLDGELNVEEMATVQAHLDTCPDCRVYVDDALAIRAAFPTEETAELPADLKEHVMAAVAKNPQSRPKKQPWGKLAAAAACLALIVAVQHGGFGAVGTDSSATAAYAADTAVFEGSVMERSVVEEPANGEALEAFDTEQAEYDNAPTESLAETAATLTDEDPLPVVQISASDLDTLLSEREPNEITPGAARYLLTRAEFEELTTALAERDIILEEPGDSDQLWLEVSAE